MNTVSSNIEKLFHESMDVKNKVLPKLIAPVAKAINLCVDSINNGGKIMSCGNGGSAADAQHFSAELLNRFEIERAPLPGLALSTDSSTITSIGNDYDFSLIFAKQIIALGKPQDVLLAISTSGGSQNVLLAVDEIHKIGGRVIALTGKDGGKIAKNLHEGDVLINVETNKTARIQEVHIMLLHAICDGIDKLYKKGE